MDTLLPSLETLLALLQRARAFAVSGLVWSDLLLTAWLLTGRRWP